MFFSRKRQEEEAFPAVPDSLRSDSAEMPELRKTQEARADTAPSVTPYLGLRARLSQIWLNRWTILLLLVLLRVLLSIAGLDDDVDDANRRALQACTKVEDVGSAMASMPHYLSRGVNEMSAQGIEKSMDGLVAVLGLMITGIQELLLFVIGMVTDMYVCLITAFIKGSLDVASHVIDETTDAMNSAISKIADKLDDRIDDVESGLNKVSDAIEDSFIGGAFPDIPKADFGGPMKELKDLKINTDGFTKDIDELNDNIPGFREVQNLTREAIKIPFDLLKQEINETYQDFRFDRSVFPLAEKQALNFCSDNNTISDFFDSLRDMIRIARIVFIVVIVLLAIAAMVPMAYYEIRRWRQMQEHAKIVSDHSYDPMDVIYITSRPISATWGIKLASRFNGKRQILVRWAWAYATSWPALFVLALAMAGFLACACQAILLKAIEDQVPRIANQVGEFADEVVTSLAAVSAEWANDANGVVKSAESDINEDLLGWARNATKSVNNTLDTFVEEMNDGLESVFKDTILMKPIEAVIFCTVGLKVEAVQKGLTWVHDHAKVTFPLFPNDTFSSGAQESIGDDSDMNTFLATPSSVTTDEVTGAVQYVVDRLRNRIITEALISTGILLIWVILVLIGVIRALVGIASPDKGRAEGGMRYTGDNRAPLTPRQHQQDDGFAAYAAGANGDYYGGDEKLQSSPARKPMAMQSPTRTSSHGQFDTWAKR